MNLQEAWTRISVLLEDVMLDRYDHEAINMVNDFFNDLYKNHGAVVYCPNSEKPNDVPQ
jgi:hypothetical protein